MRFKLFVCPVCGVVKLQNASVGEYRPPICNGDGAAIHTSGMSFVYEVALPALPVQHVSVSREHRTTEGE